MGSSLSLALGTLKSSSVGDADLMKMTPKPKDPAPEIEEEAKDVVEKESPAIENAPEEPGLDSIETTGKSINGVSVEENPVAAPQMDQVQPVVVEETIKEEEESAQTPKRSRRVAAAKANTPKMDDNVQGDFKNPASAAPIRTLRTLTTDGTNVENVDMFIQCPCNVARIRITPCFKAAEAAAVVPAITAGSAAKRRRGGRRPGIISTDASLSPRRRNLPRRLRKNI